MIPLPLVALVFERGAFVREDSELAAQVLAAFAIGLPSFVLIKIFQPSFYARKDTRTPMWFSGINAVSNIALSLTLFPVYGVVGLGIATSAAGWINAVLRWMVLHFGGYFKISGITLRNILLIAFASSAMAGFLFAGQTWIGPALIDAGLLERVFWVGLLVGTAAALYFAIVIATGAVPKEYLRRIRRDK